MPYNYTPLPSTPNQPANAATFNTLVDGIDAAVGSRSTLYTAAQASLVAAVNELQTGVAGGNTNVSAQLLKEWTAAKAYQVTSVTTFNSTYPEVVQTAAVLWPDGSTGVYTAGTINATFHVPDAYTLTHATSSRTVTQPTVTRNTLGQITTKPALTVT